MLNRLSEFMITAGLNLQQSTPDMQPEPQQIQSIAPQTIVQPQTFST